MTANCAKKNMDDKSRYRILLVDDDDAQLELEKDILSDAQYELVEAHSGEDALQLLREQTFDVVLLDSKMPGMNGEQVCRSIRSDLGLELLPVIMITGDSSTEQFLRSMQAGANDFIRKPYSPLELAARTNSFARLKELTDKLESAETLVFTLARMVEARDGDTGDHCSRLSYMGTVFGEILDLDQREIEALRLGGVLHDIGKLGIPDRILLKPGKLNDEEWAVMRQHTVIGDQLLSSLKCLQAVRPIVRSHHERWDGSGYPDGLKGNDIPYLSRVFQLLDIYDALAYARPYKNAYPIEKVIRIMKEEQEKGWRDPELSTIFIDLIQNNRDRLEIPVDKVEDSSERLLKEIENTSSIRWDAQRK